MNPTIKIIKPQLPPPPPNRVVLELDEKQANGLARLLDAGVAMQILTDLDLISVLSALDRAGLNKSKYRFKKVAIKSNA